MKAPLTNAVIFRVVAQELRAMKLVVKVVKNRAGNMLFLLVRGPSLAEWALKVMVAASTPHPPNTNSPSCAADGANEAEQPVATRRFVALSRRPVHPHQHA